MGINQEITCDWVHSYRDYDGSWESAQCTDRAVVHVTGYDIEGPMAPDDDARIDVFCCDDHAEGFRGSHDVIDGKLEVIPEHYRQGYAQGVSEGELAPMSTQSALIMAYEGELPCGFEARRPLSGEWADEAVDWSDDEVEHYRDGLTRGWTYALMSRANVIVGAEQDTD